MTNKNSNGYHKSKTEIDFGLTPIEFAKPLIREIFITRPEYYFSLPKEDFEKETNLAIQNFLDKNGEELLAKYGEIEPFFVQFFRRFLDRVYEFWG